MRQPRGLLLVLHRHVGLCLAAFLLLAGPTGSVAAFHDALDARLNPDLFRARTHGEPLPLSALAARLQQQVPDDRLGYIVYRPATGATVRACLQPRSGARPAQLRNELFLDPATGEVQGARDADGCCLGRRVVIPFLYRFHYSLGLGRTGILVMGIVASVWTLDCVVGLLLTLPVRGVPWRRDSWRRWGLAWRIAPDKGGIRRVFDLHRALSLWLWIVLLGVAVSGVSLNLQSELFRPLVAALLPVTPEQRAITHPAVRSETRIGLDEADRLATRAAAGLGWRGPPGAAFFSDGAISFYFSEAGGHRAPWLGGPVVTLDDRTGQVLSARMPGRERAGDTVLALQFPWHSGAITGLAGRIVIAATGLVVPVLVVTGVLIWNRKRRPARRPGDRRTAARGPTPS